MKTGNSGPPIVIPILLAVVGLGALATAIVLVPPLVDRVVEARLSGQVSSPGIPGTPTDRTGQLQTIPARGVEDPVETPARTEEAAPTESAVDEKGPEAAPEAAEGAGVRSEAEAEPEAEPEEAARPEAPEQVVVSGRDEWVIKLDSKSYEIDSSADPIIDEIIAVLASDSSKRVRLTGINHPSKSSKRAVKAARIVKERIVADVGIVKNRVVTKGDQDPEVDGVLVRAELTGGGR